ncbi:7-carboxy-7-deazaguanine synthase [Tolumonas osonensis]|uniref:7-carboxy-7-deazaguanine synthase n=1 Tax=Tolumonas osonensis TaxID=675874 RepID=A0A841GPP3_9GAMM|nr:7-carboxy-7-deazaguanine synthase QueE [Tolumonas osonensis]MBB6055493.1 7-carboxy-7-deazaguanine synthase [Tolumonas osonensis]
MIYYPINEIFQSIQGEGVFTGTPAIFIRMQGCDVGCSWCDTKNTWCLDYEKKLPDSSYLHQKSDNSDSWTMMSSMEIFKYFSEKNYSPQHVIITGGEPCLYSLLELTDILIGKGYYVQLETSGTREIKVHENVWVTVSPKIGMRGGLVVLPESINRANEIKYPIGKEKHIEDLDCMLKKSNIGNDVQICLQPINQNKNSTKLAIKTCIDRGWRLSVQLHKYIGLK